MSDKKFGVISDTNSSLIDHYEAEIVSATDYYPFGMASRVSLTGKGYGFGFNGQEMSNDIKGYGNSYTAEFWEYDSRIGRRWNLDPRPIVGVSGYAAFSNNPIWFSDPLGDTSVPAAGGVGTVDVDEKPNSLEFHKSSTRYTMSGTQTPVPSQPGQLRSFTNSLGKFSARWKTIANGVVGFEGYYNDKIRLMNRQQQHFFLDWMLRLICGLMVLAIV